MNHEQVTPDDSAWCQLCDPPHETSLAMLSHHLRDIHGIDEDKIVNAPVFDGTDPREERE